MFSPSVAPDQPHQSINTNMAAIQHPESRVLIIMTGGTICMKESPQGLVPATGFMDEAMRPRPSFNDGSICGTYAYLSIQFIFSECEPREIKKGRVRDR